MDWVLKHVPSQNPSELLVRDDCSNKLTVKWLSVGGWLCSLKYNQTSE